MNSTSDLFHRDVPAEFVARVFAVMELAQHHTFQILTKRPERAAESLNAEAFLRELDNQRVAVSTELGRGHPPYFNWPLRNVWLGTSVEDTDSAGKRVPYLLRTPAVVRWLSVEPMLGPVHLPPGWSHALDCPYRDWAGALYLDDGYVPPRCTCTPYPGGVSWVVVGG